MADFTLDDRLLSACITLGQVSSCHLLLMNNAALPWFILVPETDVTEICDLDPATHQRLFDAAAQVSRLVREHFEIDKLNVASLGNIVSQMHLHVIGRRRDDYCWPGGVWGPTHEQPYDAQSLANMRSLVGAILD